jgi:cation:H+ antiporter
MGLRFNVAASLVALGVAVYLAGSIAGFPLAGMAAALLLIAVFGEVTVYGIEGLGAHFRLSPYASSVLVNSVAVLPELFSALALGLRGLSAGNTWLAEIALLSVLVSALFNFVVLGAVGLLAGGVGVEEATLRLEVPLMRVSVASLALLTGFAVIEASLGAAGTSIREPTAILVAQLVYWLYYIVSAVKSGRGQGSSVAPRGWHLALAAGVTGMVLSAEALAGSVEEMIHSLHIRHIGEAALAVGVASSTPEAVLALLAARRGMAREAAGGLVAATSTSLLLVYPLVYLPLASSIPVDAFTAYTLATLTAMLWLTKRSLIHENLLDTSESLYLLVLALSALATLPAIK